MNEVDLKAKEKAIFMLKEEIGHDNDYGFGEKVEAQDRAVNQVSMFIDMSNKEYDSDLREFWKNVKQELLNL